MKPQLSKEDLKLLQMILEKAQALEKSFAASGVQPHFEKKLAELVVLFQNLSFSENPSVQKQAELGDHLHPGMTARHLLNFVLPIERLLDRSLRDEDIIITTDDLLPSVEFKPAQPLILVLDNLRSAFNVGSIYRMAETLRVESVYLCGYTPGSESDGVRKTAMGTENKTSSQRFERLETALSVLREKGVPILALETSPQAKSLYEGSLPSPCAFVVGNERFGLDFHTLKLCDEIRSIPLIGTKNSLNVASALSVACFEWHRQTLSRTVSQK